MQENPAAPLRVFVVWEPVLPTDWVTPTTSVLARVPDRRAVQFWDPDHQLSQSILDAARADPNHPLTRGRELGDVAWDVVIVFPRGERWDGAFPSPAFGGNPVIKVLAEFRQSLSVVLTSR